MMKYANLSQGLKISSYTFEKLLAGEATYAVAAKLAVSVSGLQDFINGQVKNDMTKAFGISASSLQELRDALGREGAIGMIIGTLVKNQTAVKNTSAFGI